MAEESLRAEALLPRLLEAAGKGRLALFFDYDGTLTPIVSRPEDAILAPRMRERLKALAERLPVAVVSGRDLRDVVRLVGIEELVYAGSHGFEIVGPGGLKEVAPAAEEYLPALERAADALRQRLSTIEGVQVEQKRFAIAVHYRRAAPRHLDSVAEAVEAVVKGEPRLRQTLGKKILELRPAIDWDKGRAVLHLLEVLRLDGPDCLPVYLGDDVTDEDAFRALSGRGLAILVEGEAEPHPSVADYRLADVEALGRFLDRLIEGLP